MRARFDMPYASLLCFVVMTDGNDTKQAQKQREREQAEARKAQALRDNLRRRKSAAKNRN